mgnify:CR=1 FL=1
MNNLFVVLLGIGTVFTGLVCIIILCKIISLCCNTNKKVYKPVVDTPVSVPQNAAPVTKKAEIPNRRETVAAIAAAIAEDLDTDVSAIRILSIEQM